MNESAGKSTSNVDYIQRMNDVMNFIHSHLSEPLSVSTLANQANYSIYHFQRVFKEVTGDSVNDFVHRLRIQKARKMLLFQSDMELTTIAHECGYDSSANFSRKFKQLIGITASEYRHKNRLSNRIHPEPLLQEMNQYPVVIQELPPTRVAYVRHMNGFLKDRAHPGIKEAFHKVVDFLEKRNAIHCRSRKMGITLDDPYVTPIHRCRFDACVSLDEDQNISPEGELCVRIIPGGLYASISFNSSRQKVWDLMHLFTVVWLPRSEYQLDYRHVIELFQYVSTDPVSDNTSQKSQLQFLLPIQPKRNKVFMA